MLCTIWILIPFGLLISKMLSCLIASMQRLDALIATQKLKLMFFYQGGPKKFGPFFEVFPYFYPGFLLFFHQFLISQGKCLDALSSMQKTLYYLVCKFEEKSRKKNFKNYTIFFLTSWVFKPE